MIFLFDIQTFLWRTFLVFIMQQAAAHIKKKEENISFFLIFFEVEFAWPKFIASPLCH